MLSRRRLLALTPAAVTTLHAQLFLPRKPKPRPVAAPALVFFGTDTTRPGARGIYRARFDAATGRLTAPVLAAECVRPSYLAMWKQRDGKTFVYAANEGSGSTSTVSSYVLDAGSAALQKIGQSSAGGDGPCYLAVDAEGQSAYVANYSGGSVASYRIEANGALSEPVERIDFHDARFGHHGPVASRQTGPHPHSAMLSPDNRFLIVNDLGNDDIVLFPVDAATARLGTPRVVESRVPGSGPRHLAFHPNGRWAYGINEIASRIDQYLWNEARGASGAEAMLTDTGHSVSTLDAGYRGSNIAAEIVIDPSGNHVYVSNRGEDSLALFNADPGNGALTFAQRIACGGKTPRHFTLDPTGRWLVCGNQDSGSVTVFARNAVNGRLSGPVQTVPIESPQFTLFL